MPPAQRAAAVLRARRAAPTSGTSTGAATPTTTPRTARSSSATPSRRSTSAWRARSSDDACCSASASTEAEVALARKIVEHVPSAEQVVVCNSGSEATYHAIRLARGVTGRERIIKFQGCYNGFHDYVLRNVLSAPRARRPARPAVEGHARGGGRRDARVPLQRPRGRRGDACAATPRRSRRSSSSRSPTTRPGLLPRPGFLEGLRDALRPRGHRPDLRRGDHRASATGWAATRRSAASRPTSPRSARRSPTDSRSPRSPGGGR